MLSVVSLAEQGFTDLRSEEDDEVLKGPAPCIVHHLVVSIAEQGLTDLRSEEVDEVLKGPASCIVHHLVVCCLSC